MKCVYWKEECEKGEVVVREQIVELDDGVGAETLLDLKAGDPKPGCGGERAVVDLSSERDMIEYERKRKQMKKGKVSGSPK